LQTALNALPCYRKFTCITSLDTQTNVEFTLWDLRLSWQWLWRVQSSGMGCSVSGKS
jgi:hypothetical protein